LAKILRAKVVVVHPGKKTTKTQPREQAWQLLVDGFNELIDFAKKLKVILSVENMAPHPKELVVTCQDIITLLENEGLYNRGLGLTLDVAHANVCSKNVYRFMRKVKNYILHVHLSNNAGPESKVIHSPLYEGNIDIRKVLRLLKKFGYDNYITIEGYEPKKEKCLKMLEKNAIFIRKVLSHTTIS